MKHGDLGVGAILFLFGALTAILSLNMKVGTINAIGTGFFPLALGILLMALSAIYLARVVLDLRQATPKETTPLTSKSTPATAGAKTNIFSQIEQPTVNILVVAGSMIFFALFLDTLGYPLCVLLMLLVMLRALGLKNWVAVSIIAVVAAVGSWLLFAKLLKIPLPQGFLGL